MPDLIRCFVAVELPAEVKARIERQTARLRSGSADVKWVPPENLHLTIKFLGGVPQAEAPGLADILREAVRGTEPFEVEVAGAGVFPGVKSPRVFWIGFKDPESRLSGLARRVEDALEQAGYPREQRSFTPHLTLGRFREARGRSRETGPGKGEAMAGAKRLAEELATLEGVVFGKIRLENISLMRSELSPGGARYSRLASIRFGGL